MILQIRPDPSGRIWSWRGVWSDTARSGAWVEVVKDVVNKRDKAGSMAAPKSTAVRMELARAVRTDRPREGLIWCEPDGSLNGVFYLDGIFTRPSREYGNTVDHMILRRRW